MIQWITSQRHHRHHHLHSMLQTYSKEQPLAKQHTENMTENSKQMYIKTNVFTWNKVDCPESHTAYFAKNHSITITKYTVIQVVCVWQQTTRQSQHWSLHYRFAAEGAIVFGTVLSKILSAASNSNRSFAGLKRKDTHTANALYSWEENIVSIKEQHITE